MAVRLAACGDIVIVRALSAEPLRALGEADLAFGNLEIAFGARGPARDKSYALRADPALAEQLAAAGFGLVSIANNHAMDFGPEGLIDCIDALDRVGVKHVGGGADLVAAMRPRLADVRGVRIAFVAFSALLPAGSAAGERRPGVAPLRVATAYELPGDLQGEPGLPPVIRTAPSPEDLQRLCATVREARGEADIVIVLPHWGVARQRQLCDYQPLVGRALIEAGADAVIGSHSHLLEGCEIYEGKPIFYSLSQVYLALDHPVAATMSTETAVIVLNIEGNKRVSGVTIIPVCLREAGASAAGEPAPAAGARAQDILDRIAGLSPGVRFERAGDTAVLSLA